MALRVKMDQPHSTNMCTGCPGHCCRLIVDLTPYDIFRLVHFEGLKIADFTELMRAAEDDAFAFRSMGGLIKFVLKHKENGYCSLLDEGKGLKCTVEGSKPGICLSYPFSLKEGKPYVRDDALCPPMNRKMADFAKMSVPVLEDGRWEWARYQEMVDDWNLTAKGDEPPEEMLKFAAREMDLETYPLGRMYRKIKRSLLWKLKGH